MTFHQFLVDSDNLLYDISYISYQTAYDRLVNSNRKEFIK